jgi:uncharacterized protein YbaP (TraB family)
MKFYSFFTLVLLFLTSCSSSEDVHTSANTEDIVLKNDNSLLWKIEKDGYQTSYIFGTMHMIDDIYFNITPHLQHLIEKSDLVIMEIGGQPNPLTALKLMTLKGETINDYFTKDELSVLVQFMDVELGISPKQFQMTYTKMKPFLILQTITQAFFSENAKSYDLSIMQISQEKNIPLIGFETMEEQLGFFDLIPNKDIAKMIMASVKDFEKEKKGTEQLMKLYAKEKVDKLIPLMKDQSPEFMEFEDLFLTNRNTAWIPKITKDTKEKKCFIAVGAAHLFESKGIIKLLKEEGFTLTPIEK